MSSVSQSEIFIRQPYVRIKKVDQKVERVIHMSYAHRAAQVFCLRKICLEYIFLMYCLEYLYEAGPLNLICHIQMLNEVTCHLIL